MEIVKGTSNYAKLLGWEVYNFMTITHGKVEFDARNILNFKGYNDSGKSAMLRALDVCMYNIKPNSQCDFIQDDKDYFRVLVYFEDGVVILRDKYINGQSLYEMYKGNDLVYSSKQNGVLTKITKVPDIIEEYLGLISYESMYLNSRSCFEKQLLVQTTGSENYKFLNSVLKSEEISVASSMLNTDKNKLLSDIGVVETELNGYRLATKDSVGLTVNMITALKSYDKNLDDSISKSTILGALKDTSEKISQIPSIPMLEQVDSNQIGVLYELLDKQSKLSSIPILPKLNSIEDNQLGMLVSLKSSLSQLNSIPYIPELYSVESNRLDFLTKLSEIVASYQNYSLAINEQTERLDALNKESQSLEMKLSEYGKKVTRCKNCGALVELESGSCC